MGVHIRAGAIATLLLVASAGIVVAQERPATSATMPSLNYGMKKHGKFEGGSTGRVFTSPPGDACAFTARAKFPEGTRSKLQFAPAAYVPWESKDNLAWRTVKRTRVKNSTVRVLVTAKSDGYWRWKSGPYASEPWFLDLWPTSDLADPGGPQDLSCLR